MALGRVKGLTAAQKRALDAYHAPFKVWGTPENCYLDSGIWKWLQYVQTKDEQADTPVRPFPLEKEYVQVLIIFMLGLPELWIVKSRQMFVTWTQAAFCAWTAWRREHSLVLYQTKKEDDANAMVSEGDKDPVGGRMAFIINSLPDFLGDPAVKKGSGNRVGELIHVNNSRIKAVPQGANQVRGPTPTLYCADEAAFQEEFPGAYSAAMAAINKNGRVIITSTVYPGFFNDCTEEAPEADKEATDAFLEKHPWIKNIAMPKGMRFYLSRVGSPCLELHYSADPERDPATERGRAWVEIAAKRYKNGGTRDPDWRREMEIDRESSGGKLVFPFLTDPMCPVYRRNLSAGEIEDMELYAGFDFGTQSPSAFVVWGVNTMGELYAVWELYKKCENYKDLVREIKACPYYKRIVYIKCDHSLGNRSLLKSSTGQVSSVLQLFSEEGLHMTCGRKGADYSVAQRLLGSYWADPYKPRAFITDACPNLARECRRLRWKQHRTESARAERNDPEQIMQKDNHAFDASAYILDTRERVVATVDPAVQRFSHAAIMQMIRDKNAKESERRGYINVI